MLEDRLDRFELIQQKKKEKKMTIGYQLSELETTWDLAWRLYYTISKQSQVILLWGWYNNLECVT